MQTYFSTFSLLRYRVAEKNCLKRPGRTLLLQFPGWFCDLFFRLLKEEFEHNTADAVFFDEMFFIYHPIHQLLFEVSTYEAATVTGVRNRPPSAFDEF